MRILERCGFVFLSAVWCFAQTPAKTSLNLDDLYHLQDVSDPQCSPDGKWVAPLYAPEPRGIVLLGSALAGLFLLRSRGNQ